MMLCVLTKDTALEVSFVFVSYSVQCYKLSLHFPKYLTNKLFWPQLFKRYRIMHYLNRQGGSDAMTIQSDPQKSEVCSSDQGLFNVMSGNTLRHPYNCKSLNK